MRASARRFAQRKLWLWLLGALGGSGLAYVLVFGLAAAVLGASFAGCEPGSEPALAASSGPTPSAYALQSIPPGTPGSPTSRPALASTSTGASSRRIGAQECGNGDCAGTNSSGCAGPMQIAYVRGSPCSPGPGPTLWERFAVSAHPGQAPSVNDPADAIDTAARILRQDMGAPATVGKLRRIPPGGLALRRRLRRLIGELRGRGDGPRRAIRVHRHRLPHHRRAHPWQNRSSSGGCSSSVFAPEAAGSSQIVKVAESQVGQLEHPEGSNCTIYGPCEEWCSLFTAWVWQHAGRTPPGLHGHVWILRVALHLGQRTRRPSAPANGDASAGGRDLLRLRAERQRARRDRRQVLPDGEIVTVEGNYAGHVTRVGPFSPADPVGEAAPVYGYAQPPAAKSAGGA